MMAAVCSIELVTPSWSPYRSTRHSLSVASSRRTNVLDRSPLSDDCSSSEHRGRERERESEPERGRERERMSHLA